MKYVIATLMVLILLVACQPETQSVLPTTPLVPPAPQAIAPATLQPPIVSPQIVEKATTFDAVKYNDPTYQFSVAYPAGWTPTPTTLKGGVFYAKGPGGDFVHIAVRPATNFRDAAITYLKDLIASTGISLSPNIDNEKTISLADGTQANVILLSASMFEVKAAVTGVIKDGNAIMICGARNPKNLELYQEIGSTLVVKTATPNTSLSQSSDIKTTQVVPAATDQATSLKVIFDRQGIMYSTNIDGSGLIRISRSSDMSPDSKTIVFEKYTDFGNTWLYLKDADGTNIRPILPITGAGPFYQFPAWSPDGNKIAFSKSKTQSGSRYVAYDIWIMNPDGSGITNITTAGDVASDVSPQWFPDSTKIAYASKGDGLWSILTTPIDRKEPALIVRLQQNFNAGWVPWDYKVSQDGKRIIYRDGPGSDLKTMVVDIVSKKITEWPNIDTSEISPVKSQDGIVTVIIKPDGLYYTDNSHKEPVKIPSTNAGDIAIKLE